MKVLAFIMLFSLSSYSETQVSKPVYVAVPAHPGYSDLQNPGYLNELFGLLKDKGFQAKILYLPLKRAIEGYSSGKCDCMAGGDEELIKFYGGSPENKVFSLPYHVITSRILTKGKEPICDIRQLNGKSLIVIDNFPYKKVLKGVEFSRVEKAPSAIQGVKMVLKNRADALLTYYPTPEKGLEKLVFCPSLAFTKTFEKVHCDKNKASIALVRKFSRALNSLRSEGKLDKLLLENFGEYGKEIKKAISPK